MDKGKELRKVFKSKPKQYNQSLVELHLKRARWFAEHPNASVEECNKAIGG